MIDVKEALRIAQEEASESGLEVDPNPFDDGKYYIFDFLVELETLPIAIDKETGKSVCYFPPEHPEFFERD